MHSFDSIWISPFRELNFFCPCFPRTIDPRKSLGKWKGAKRAFATSHCVYTATHIYIWHNTCQSFVENRRCLIPWATALGSSKFEHLKHYEFQHFNKLQLIKSHVLAKMCKLTFNYSNLWKGLQLFSPFWKNCKNLQFLKSYKPKFFNASKVDVEIY